MAGVAHRITKDGGGGDFVYAAHQSNKRCQCPSHWHKQVAEYHGIVGIDDLGMGSSVVRAVTNGILFKIAVSIAGRQKIGLIDSGASYCYMSPEMLQFVNYY